MHRILSRYLTLILVSVFTALSTAAAAMTLGKDSLVAVLPGASSNLSAWDTAPSAQDPYETTRLQPFVTLLRAKFGSKAHLITKSILNQMETMYDTDAKAANAAVYALSAGGYTHVIAIARGSTSSAGTTMKLSPAAIENDKLLPANPFIITVENDDEGKFPGKLPDPVAQRFIAEFGGSRAATDNKKIAVEIGCFMTIEMQGTLAWYVASYLPNTLMSLYEDSGKLAAKGYTLADGGPPLKSDCTVPKKGMWKGTPDAEYGVYGMVWITAENPVGLREIRMHVNVYGHETEFKHFVPKALIEQQPTSDTSEFGKMVIETKLLDAYIDQWLSNLHKE